jgi:hypothetical protein
MKKETKYAILASISILVGLATFFLIKSNKLSTGQSPAWALLPVIIILIIGIFSIEKKHKEPYSDSKTSDDGCNQTINIYQNCSGPGPNPNPIPDGPIQKSDVMTWIKSIDSQLTATCQNCIANTAVKMWKKSDLTNVKSMSIDRQKVILNAMLVIDCNSQCIIPPSGLDRKQVEQWVAMVGKNISPQCQTCAVDHIMKLWAPTDFDKVRIRMMVEQQKILQGVIALNCPNCETSNKLNPTDVQKWISLILTGAKPDCYNCIVSSIVNLWDNEQFTEVKKMDKKSQVQVVQALIAMNCEKQCIEVPSGLTPQQAQSWLNSVLVGESTSCAKCLNTAIVKNWSQAILSIVKSKPHADQVKILQALIAMNCESNCHPTPSENLTKTDISNWLKKILPSLSTDCSGCIVDSAFSMWDKQEFTELLAKSCEDQVKIARLIGDYSCPHVCNIPPINPCN